MDQAMLQRDRDRLAVAAGQVVLVLRRIQREAHAADQVLELAMRGEQITEYCVEQLEDSELRRGMVVGMREGGR